MKPDRKAIYLARQRRQSIPDGAFSTLAADPSPDGRPLASSAHGRFRLGSGRIDFFIIPIRLTAEQPEPDDYIDTSVPSAETSRPVLERPIAPEPEPEPEPVPARRYRRDSSSDELIAAYIERTKQLTFRMIICAAVAAFLAFMELLPVFTGSCPDMFSPERAPAAYLVQNFALTGLCVGLSWRQLFDGIKSIFRRRFDGDSVLSAACAAVLIQMLAQLIWCTFIERGPVARVFGAPLCIALLINDAGRLISTLRCARGLEFAAVRNDRTAVMNVDNLPSLSELIREGTSRGKNIVYGVRTRRLSDYNVYAAEEDFCEHFMNKLSPYICILALIAAVVGGIIGTSVWTALSCLCAVLAVGTPVGRLICINLPLERASGRLLRSGVMLNGWAAVDEFGSTNTIAVSSEQLFPQGTVRLLKTNRIGDTPIAETMLYAGSVVNAVGGPLARIFGELVSASRSALPAAQDVRYEDGLGVFGWVEDRPVLVGNRQLLVNHGCDIPSLAYEARLKDGDCRSTVYVAISGKLRAVMLVEYSAEKPQTAALRRLFENGIALLVYTCDPNISDKLIADVFGVPRRMVSILGTKAGSAYDSLTHITKETAPALLASSGKLASLAFGVGECVRLKRVLTVSALVFAAIFALGLLLVVLLCCLGAASVDPAHIMLIQLAYIIIAFIPTLVS